jgi:gamma-glutamyltranspeptidase/glutathione hydrolase
LGSHCASGERQFLQPKGRAPSLGAAASPFLARSFGWLVPLLAVLLLRCPQGRSAEAMHGMVASVHPAATEAGVAVLRDGGNAVDAAVAVGLTLGVVDGADCGIGGGCFILARLADGKIVAIDGRERAPAAASRDMYVRDGKPHPDLSQTGALAIGVPGALAAYDYAVHKFGRKKLGDLLLPAARLAEQGFQISRSYAHRLKNEAPEIVRFEAARAIFFRDGRPIEAGDTLVQEDLAQTYRLIAQHGASWFYRGPFATVTEDWMKQNGGLMTARDFRDYKISLREPIHSRYRGREIISFPPPSSGGVHVAEILNILDHFDLKAMDEATRLHVIAEAMKQAFADRSYWLGDPDYARVPRGLVSEQYGATLAARINTNYVTKIATHGEPPDWQSHVFGRHTTHFSVADSEGNWVACTATVNTSFGSKVVIPGTGVVMNNQMDDFSIQPGVTNYFGLVGGEANAVAGGKRPLSSMAPTLVLENGRPICALGAAGGPKIISQVVQELVCMLDLGMSPQEAITAPRVHHQWLPDELVVEKSLSPAVQAGLERLGYHLKPSNDLGVSQIVAQPGQGSGFTGAADPRGGGSARGL